MLMLNSYLALLGRRSPEERCRGSMFGSISTAPLRPGLPMLDQGDL